MEKAIAPIEDYVTKGAGERFYSVFSYPLLFTNNVDKKATYAKQMANNQKLKLPFAIASYSSDEIDSARYSALSLARRGVYLATLDDNMQVFNVKLIPTLTTFRLTVFAEDLQTLRLFAKRWLFAAQKNDLNFSLTYGSSDFDVRVEMDPSIQYPDPSGGVDEAKEFELTATFKVAGFMSEEWTRTQTAVVVDVEGQLGSSEAVAQAIRGNPAGVTQVFQFRRN